MTTQLCIVLRAVNYKDYDRILTLFSREKGKMTAQASGARRVKSALSASAQPFCCAEYELSEFKGRQYVKNALVKEKFFHIQNDYGKYTAACTMLELTDRLLEHTADFDRLFLLLVNTLYAMEHNGADENAALAYFFVQSVVLMGIFPALDFCAACGKPVDRSRWWSHTEGGAVCEVCAPNMGAVKTTNLNSRLFALLRGAKPDAVSAAAGVVCGEKDMKRFLRFAAQYLQEAGEIKLYTVQFLDK